MVNRTRRGHHSTGANPRSTDRALSLGIEPGGFRVANLLILAPLGVDVDDADHLQRVLSVVRPVVCGSPGGDLCLRVASVLIVIDHADSVVQRYLRLFQCLDSQSLAHALLMRRQRADSVTSSDCAALVCARARPAVLSVRHPR